MAIQSQFPWALHLYRIRKYGWSFGLFNYFEGPLIGHAIAIVSILGLMLLVRVSEGCIFEFKSPFTFSFVLYEYGMDSFTILHYKNPYPYDVNFITSPYRA